MLERGRTTFLALAVGLASHRTRPETRQDRTWFPPARVPGAP